MKLSSNADAAGVAYESVTNFDSLSDFDRTTIECLSRTWKENVLEATKVILVVIVAEVEAPGTNVGTKSNRR